MGNMDQTTKQFVCMFPGQGAQAPGMGADLFDQFPQHVAIANEICGYDLQTLCLDDPQNRLNQTQYTQPALFVVSALYYLRYIEAHPLPAQTSFLGHSLGEFNALFAAGAFDYETGVQLVQKRGELMASMQSGGMYAIIGLSQQEVHAVLQQQHPELDIANINSPMQTVIAGPLDQLELAADTLEELGASCVALKVSGAFHSRYMMDCKLKFSHWLDQFTFSPLQYPVIANSTASSYRDDSIKETLVQQMVSPVRWLESINALQAEGRSAFMELGPGTILTDLLGRIQKQRLSRAA